MKLKSLLTLTLLFSFVSTSVAAPPKLSITVNTKINNGNEITVKKDDPVNLEISLDKGATLAVFCVPKVAYDTTSDGKRVIFFAKKSCVFLVAAFNGTEVAKAEFHVIVDGSPPGPNPNPGPGPNPNPTPGPIPTSALGKAMYEAGMKVNSPTRLADCKAMLEGLRKYRPTVAGTNLEPKQIAAGIVTSMITELPENGKKPWITPLTSLVAVPLAKAITDKQSGLQAIDDLIAGLKAVK